MVTPAHSAPARRSIPHRIALWISATLLAMTVYAASYPFTFQLTLQRFPQAFPYVQVVFAPLQLRVRHPDWIGNEAYSAYCAWAVYTLQEPFGNAESNSRLDVTMQADFTATSLRDVVKFFSELMAWPIELEPDVNGDAEVTVSSNAPLRDVLKETLEPLGRVAWPADGRIAIGTPAAIQLVRAEERATHPLPNSGWLLLALFCISAISLLILLRRRRGANQISTEPTG